MQKRLVPFVAMTLACVLSVLHTSAQAQRPAQRTLRTKYDIVIQGGRIVDGTGAPWYYGDVGIADGIITHIGRIKAEEAETVIDAKGLIVAPGFVDMMGQTATPMMEDPDTAINLLTQGITTINAGEGASAAPLGEEAGLRKGWTTLAEYFALLESKGLPVNVVQTVGHTQIRRIVIGDVERRPTEAELKQMQGYVREAMEAGAIGVSTALIYPPAVYAETEEIAALAEVAGEYGGRYYTHMRNEGDQLLEAIDEALEIGRIGKCPVHIFHLKAAGKQNWGKMQLAISKIKEARSVGEQVTADIYPYINNGLGIAALIHPRHFTEGYDVLRSRLDDENLRAEIRNEIETTKGWENWYRHAGKDWNRVIIGQTNVPEYEGLDGQSVAAIAETKGEDPWDTFFTLVKAGAFALPETMTDANKILAMQQEFVSFCTDVGPAGGSRSASHPRAFGSFPRLLSRYVRDLGAISLEQAVSQAGAVACNDVLAYDRGRLSVGLAADIIVFDYEKLTDRADFVHPHAVSEGVQHVIVNGRLVLKDGEMTGTRPGRVLRGPGYREETAPYNVASGEPDPQFAGYDRRIKAFMQEHRIPGLAVAVTNNGQTVFSRGYGYADIANREPVRPTSLFRIASISKPITAVAILQLIEQGKLNLDDNVFAVLDYEAEMTAAGDRCDPRLQEITIRHLLEHRGGWDRGQSFDAMFQSIRFAEQVGVEAPADQEAIIQAMCSQQLDFDPGERYAYSNFGYCLLGRVIEKLTEQTYDDYVKQHVLAPIGVTTMKIGKTHLDGRAENEVRYYHPGADTSVFQDDLNEEVPSPYGGWFLESMDSHGAWIASAEDLAKFAAAFDDPGNCPILSRESIDLMYRRPPGLAGYEEDGSEKERFYSLGWMNRVVGDGKINHWHTGSLPGTATIMIRRHDGKNFVALMNCRVSPSATHLGRAIEELLHEAADEVDWPATGVKITPMK
jgi:N-acyl-D-amino-acid deacylase